jgi:hypothetical protein
MTDIVPDDEVENLTRPLKQPAARARRLAKILGCKVERRPDGTPIVTRDMLARIGQVRPAQNDAGITWSKPR